MVKKVCNLNFINIYGIFIFCLTILGLYLLIKSVIINNTIEPLEGYGEKIVDYTGLDKDIKINPLSGPTILPTKPGCYMTRSTECARPDGNGGWKNGSTAGFNYWANYGYQMFPHTTSKSTQAEIDKSNAKIAAGMSPADQATKCNKTGMLSWCSNSDKAVGKYPKIDWDVISIPYPKGTSYYNKTPLPVISSKPPPSEPGCYEIFPTGCEKRNIGKKSWTADTWGYEYGKPPTNSSVSACKARGPAYNSWCDKKDIKMHYNPVKDWKECAKENEECEGKGLVKFGIDPDKWIYKYSKGTIGCSNRTFGKDPAYGEAKKCYVAN